MEEFEILVKNVRNSIPILIEFHDCIAWNDFTDKGNTCYVPQDFSSNESERKEAALVRAAVIFVVKKGGAFHLNLSKELRRDLGVCRLSYDVLVKMIARILCGTSCSELNKMVRISRLIRKKRMDEKGIKTIGEVMA